MPRRVIYHNQSAADPQTMLQGDKDPMLSLNPDCNSDTDPAGDLGKGKVLHHTLVMTWQFKKPPMVGLRHTTNHFMRPASKGTA